MSYTEALEQARAEETAGNPGGWPVCVLCGHIGFHYPDRKAMDFGHVYSEAGLAEWKNNNICEYCFDVTTADPDLTPEEQEEQNRIDNENFEIDRLNEELAFIREIERGPGRYGTWHDEDYY